MHYVPHPEQARRMTTDELRDGFLVGGLFQPGSLQLRVIDLDRVVLGGAVPTGEPIALTTPEHLAAEYFCERRELGILNIGGPGTVTVDGTRHAMANRDGLYVGRGSCEVAFESDDAQDPARYYLISYLAHAEYPTMHVSRDEAESAELGSQAEANHRRIHRYFHLNGVRTSQLVMGFTELQEGSVWNTMPCHTHARRSEVYLYFDVAPDAVVFHFMGDPQETRSLVVRDGDVVLSPGWSIHSGVGTRSYTFCWAMGGENQVYSDMQGVRMQDLR